MSPRKPSLLIVVSILLLSISLHVQTAHASPPILVSNTNSSGNGSLAAAITAANNAPGADVIQFAISGAGVHTILVTSALPTITDAVMIDGTTQSGANCGTTGLASATLLIELRGTGSFTGLVLNASNSSIRGLVINSFSDAGIIVSGNGNTIACNQIGTNVAGTAALPNGSDGVRITGSGNTIGGATLGNGNLISGNAANGVQISGAGAAGNTLAGNYIGTDLTGAVALPNAFSGVFITAGATNNVIGGTTSATRNVISGNSALGIDLSGANTTGNKLQGNYIGTTATGDAALGNGTVGVAIEAGASGNIIGGTVAGAGNLISGNAASGISIDAANTNTVTGNRIGTNAAATARLNNGGSGIFLSGGATGNTIGGTSSASRNIISGNTSNGIGIDGAGTNSNTVVGNYIGTNGTGTSALPNTSNGLRIDDTASSNLIGGTTVGAGNLISGNGQAGVLITDGGTTANTLAGNLIGTNATGTAALPNGDSGVKVASGADGNTIGGTVAGTRNVISGNAQSGITLTGSGTTANLIEGNYIGTDINGSAKLANGADGVGITASVSGNTIGGLVAGARNIISGNAANGVLISGAGTNDVQGNSIGTDATGQTALGNAGNGVVIRAGAVGNKVGGVVAGADNLISGNANNGILVSDTGTTNTLIANNAIGVDLDGNSPLPNVNAGILIAAGATSTTVDSNLISGNTAFGIRITGSGTAGNLVTANYLGTDLTGASAVPNGIGITVDTGAANNTIGGTVAGTGNLIAFNNGVGLQVKDAGSTGNALLRNSISSNGLLGIDLSGDGPTPNDASDTDIGPNNLQNFPLLSTAASSSGSVTVSGSLNSAPSTVFRVEFFDNPTCDASGYGEGNTFLSAINVTTNSAGSVTFNQALGSIPVGHSITATATDAANNTSEFSNCVAVVLQRKPDTIGVYQNGVFHLRNSNSTGYADISVAFGSAGNLPVTGDWNGDGVDTVGVYVSQLGVFYLRDSNTPGSPDYSFVMGNPGDEPLAGKWDATMTHDGIGVYRPSNGLLYLKRSLSTGYADYPMVLGNPGDHGIAGDWDGNGYDSVGVYRPSRTRFFLANTVAGTISTPAIIFDNYNFAVGPANLVPIAGDWQATGVTRVGYVLNGVFNLKYTFADGGPDVSFAYGNPGALPVTGKWTGLYGTAQPRVNVLVAPPATAAPIRQPAVSPTAAPNTGGGQFD